MRLLTQLDYHRLLEGEPTKIQPDESSVSDVLQYATSVWDSLGLKPRELGNQDILYVYQFGTTDLYHIKAFPRKMPDTFVIVAKQDAETVGHILFDIASEYGEAHLECPQHEFEGVVNSAEFLEQMIASINHEGDDPFAILEKSEGTYIQTMRTEDGFIVEYQLVNTSNHYELTELASEPEVLSLMKSYAFGKLEWLTDFEWQKQEL